MPRRKKTISEVETAPLVSAQAQEATPAEETPLTPTRRRRRTVSKPAPEPTVASASPPTIEAPETPVLEPEAQATKRRRRKPTVASASPPTTEVPEPPVLERDAQATKRRRRRTPVASASPPTVEVPEPPTLERDAQATRRRRRKATGASASPPTTEAQPPVASASPPTTEIPEPPTLERDAQATRRRRRKATGASASPPTTEAQPPVASASPPTTEIPEPPVLERLAQATRRRRRKKTEPPAETPTPQETEPIGETTTLVEVEPVAPAEEPKKKSRRPRRRKKAGPEAVEAVDDAAAVVVEPEPEIPPPPPIRHPLVRVQFQNGVPTIHFGERVFRPHFFFGNPHTPEAAVRVQQQMQLAAEAGVHLYSLLITLPVRETGATDAFEQIRYWTALARETEPDAHILWRIAFAPVGKWQAEYPEAVIRFADGSVGGPSICADRWWQVAKEQLVALINLVEQEDEGGATLGYHLDYGEWFLSESGGYDTSEAALQAFREWLRRQYKNDSVVLRACWFNGEVNFNTATLPPFQPTLPHGRVNHFYHPRREGRWIDYHRFLSDITARRILGLAQAVKEASQGRALVGAPYGYVLEWKHPHAGHFALTQLLRSEHIDFLSAPLSYATRLPGELGALPVPVDSINLHRKLFLSEEDYRTPFGKAARLTDPSTGHHLASGQAEATPDDDYNPPLHTAQAVQQVHQRSLAQSLTLAHGEMWMDLWGEGWLAHSDAWNAARLAHSVWSLRARAPQTPPEVAVIIDPESTRYVRTGSPLIEQMIGQAREAVLRSGASVGFYLLEDIAQQEFPPSRVVIFLNAWRMSRAAHEAIRKRLQRDGRVLVWLYASTLFHGHRDALANARETLGVAIARQPWASMQGTQIVNKAHPLARFLKTDKIGAMEPWEPSFYAIAEGCDVIGEYIDTGLPSLAVCDHKTWKAVFLGERRLTPELVRSLIRWAGGHIWLDTNDLVQARYPWVHVHARKGGVRTLQFPMPLSVYDTSEGGMVAESVMEHALYLQEGESRLLLTAPHEQLLKLLQGEPIELDPYFQLIETPAEPEPVDEAPAPVAEPDWEEPVLEPIALEESPFEPIEPDIIAEEPLAEEPTVTATSSSSDSSEPRARRRVRNHRRRKTARPAKQESAPPAEKPIIAVQWRRTGEES